MVGLIDRNSTVSTTESLEDFKEVSFYSPQTSSVESYYTDPDLLIREYFLASSSQRSDLRRRYVKAITSYKSVLEVLRWGVDGRARDAYDGAVDLLAEIKNIQLFADASLQLAGYSANQRILDNLWNVLIQSVACAYQIPVKQRFELLNLLPVSNRRSFKTAIIDALVLIADELDIESFEDTKNRIVKFGSENEKDQYVRDYAKEALQELA